MNIRRSLVALAGVIVFGAAVAAASAGNGPPVPSGCSFDPGVLTCVTTTTTSKTEGPFNPGTVPVSTTFGGVITGLQVCNTLISGPWTAIDISGLTFNLTVTTTTTTERHGLHGKVFATQVSTTQAITDLHYDTMECFYT